MIRSLISLVVAAVVITPKPSVAPSLPPLRLPLASPGASASPSAASPALPSPAASSKPSTGASFDVGVWTVHMDSVDTDFKTGSFSTPKKIVMTRNGGDVSADRADGNYKQQVLNLYGHVVMHDSSGGSGSLESARNAGSNGPSTLTADKAQIDGQAKVYKAFGHVHYVQNDTVVDSDNGTLNDKTHDLFLQGDVHVNQGARSLIAQTVNYNTVTGQAHAEGDVTMSFPGTFNRGLATPKPIKVPKNRFVEPVTPAPAQPAAPAPATSPPR
jgi:hypothetical protein